MNIRVVVIKVLFAQNTILWASNFHGLYDNAKTACKKAVLDALGWCLSSYFVA